MDERKEYYKQGQVEVRFVTSFREQIIYYYIL